MPTSFRRKLSKSIAALATVVAGTVVAVVPAAAAQADPVTIQYCQRVDLPNGRHLTVCWPITVDIPLFPIPFPCLHCPEAIQFRYPIDIPDIDASLAASGLLDGLRSTLQAQAAQDPETADAYRVEARKKYSLAVSHLGQADLKVGNIWRNYDINKAAGDPEPQPNLWATYGNETILGLSLLRAALADPKNAPQLTSRADAAFDRGATAFTKAWQA